MVKEMSIHTEIRLLHIMEAERVPILDIDDVSILFVFPKNAAHLFELNYDPKNYAIQLAVSFGGMMYNDDEVRNFNKVALEERHHLKQIYYKGRYLLIVERTTPLAECGEIREYFKENYNEIFADEYFGLTHYQRPVLKKYNMLFPRPPQFITIRGMEYITYYNDEWKAVNSYQIGSILKVIPELAYQYLSGLLIWVIDSTGGNGMYNYEKSFLNNCILTYNKRITEEKTHE